MAYIDDYLDSLQELDGMVSSAGMIGARYEGPAQKKEEEETEEEEK
jgi:hypothetical protein